MIKHNGSIIAQYSNPTKLVMINDIRNGIANDIPTSSINNESYFLIDSIYNNIPTMVHTIPIKIYIISIVYNKIFSFINVITFKYHATYSLFMAEKIIKIDNIWWN